MLVVALLVALGAAQYPAWLVTSVYAGPQCGGEVVAQVARATLIPDCYALVGASPCRQTPANASDLLALPGAWQRQQCLNFLPRPALAYKFQHGILGTGDCGEFYEGYGWRSGCQRVESNSTFRAFRPACYENATIVWGYTDDNCVSGETAFFTLDVAPLKQGGPYCRKQASDNQSSWLSTCPNIEKFGAAGRLAVSGVTMFVVVLLGIIML